MKNLFENVIQTLHENFVQPTVEKINNVHIIAISTFKNTYKHVTYVIYNGSTLGTNTVPKGDTIIC